VTSKAEPTHPSLQRTRARRAAHARHQAVQAPAAAVAGRRLALGGLRFRTGARRCRQGLLRLRLYGACVGGGRLAQAPQQAAEGRRAGAAARRRAAQHGAWRDSAALRAPPAPRRGRGRERRRRTRGSPHGTPRHAQQRGTAWDGGVRDWRGHENQKQKPAGGTVRAEDLGRPKARKHLLRECTARCGTRSNGGRRDARARVA